MLELASRAAREIALCLLMIALTCDVYRVAWLVMRSAASASWLRRCVSAASRRSGISFQPCPTEEAGASADICRTPGSRLTHEEKIHQVAQGPGHAQRRGGGGGRTDDKLIMAMSKLTPSEVLAEKHRKLAETASASQT
jgi:hypothetical protein